MADFSKHDLVEPSAMRQCPSCLTHWKTCLHDQAAYYGCIQCQKLINLRKNRAENLKFKEVAGEPVLKLGQKGMFDNVEYEVVGIAQWKEQGDSFLWFEYSLFHVKEGYKTLAHADGHWNLFVKVLDYPRNTDPHREPKLLKHKEMEFQLFHKYNSEIAWASGEFIHDISETPRPWYTEWICPPYILTKEVSTHSYSWYEGTYYTTKSIEQAFKLEKSLPKANNIGSTQPLLIPFKLYETYSLTIAFAFLLFITQLFITPFDPKPIIEDSFTDEYNENASAFKPFISQPFEITPSIFTTTSLEVEFKANVDNSWAEAQITLINDDTDEEYELELGVEYYHGYDGGPWSEGSITAHKLISEISPGKYHMVIIHYAETKMAPVTMYIKATQDVSLWSNFWYSVLGLLLFPLGVYFYTQHFEKKRWMNSNYNPYD